MNMSDDLQKLFADLDNVDDPASHCFLCGRHLEAYGQTDEHVVPQWAQRRYGLWDQQIVLLNGTSLPYRQLTVPCCEECNRYRLKPVEDSMSQTVDLGRGSVVALPREVIFLWLGKIFYGILYRELMLLLKRDDPSSGRIITQDFIHRYRMHRFFLQQARGLVDLQDFHPGSIFIFDAQPLPDKRMHWDLTDNVDSVFIMVRVGKVALMGALADGGAQQLEEEIYKEFYSLSLHPLQIRELCARIAYRSMSATRVPKYLTVESHPHKTWQMPLGGLSAKPLFDEFNPSVYAKVLAHYTGYPLDFLYRPPDKLVTWLTDENGHLRTMPFSEFPDLPRDPEI